MVWFDELRLFLAWAAIPIGIFLVRRHFRNLLRGNVAQTSGSKCQCGYPLEGLDHARCPECGRVIGFDATAEQLGLTAEELERAQRKRTERANSRAAEKPPNPPPI